MVYFLPRDGYEIQQVHGEVEDLFDLKKIKSFKSRPETRKNYFAKGVPAEATYLRVEYDAQYAQLDKKLTGKSFSQVCLLFWVVFYQFWKILIFEKSKLQI